MSTFDTAAACLAAMEARYASLTTYADTGDVRPDAEGSLTNCWFSTAFVRGGGFRFHFHSPHPYPPLRHIVSDMAVGIDHAGIYSWMRDPSIPLKTEIESSIQMGIARATGVSMGAAHTIGQLLFPEADTRPFSRYGALAFEPDETIEGVDCYCVSGDHGKLGRVRLWIGKHDLMLRKRVGSLLQHVETRRAIRLDQPIAPATFERET